MKERPARLLRCAAFISVFLACIYYGFVERIEGARNVVIFIAWGCLFLSCFLFAKDAQIEMRSRGRPAPEKVTATLDIIIVVSFVWFGAIATALAFATSSVLSHAAWRMALTEPTNPEGADG